MIEFRESLQSVGGDWPDSSHTGVIQTFKLPCCGNKASVVLSFSSLSMALYSSLF